MASLSTAVAAAVVADQPAALAARARFLAAAAAVLVTASLSTSNGFYDPVALFLMTLACAAAVGAAWLGSPWRRSLAEEARTARFWDRATRIALALGLAGGLVSQILFRPGQYLDPPRPLAFRLLAVAGALLAATFFLDLGPRIARLRFALLLGVFAAMGAVVLRASPSPPIDVFLFRQAGAEALSRGENPYLISVPNLYRDRLVYGTGGFAVGDRVTGFPYPPLVLLVDLPFRALLGDARLASLVAMLVAAWAVRRLDRGRDGELMGLLLLFQSRSFLVLEMAWTEPLVVACLGLLFLAVRRWLAGAPLAALTGLAAGLAAASKQYTPLMLLPVLLAAPRAGLGRALGWAAAAFAAILIPFLVWDPYAFWRGVVTWQFHQPFRMDALSWLAALARLLGRTEVTAAVGFLAAALALLALLPRRPGLAQAASVAAAAFLMFLLFNKQAFCNYYWGASGLLLAAAALCGRERVPAAEPA
ncbi:MAG TPA: glycosyltransferase 87 family protein [Anaeromyxobacteraceae bacterium]|nr:glycosyltransferase 87 family protein [Anaeromyxobacteraceae bacterium]